MASVSDLPTLLKTMEPQLRPETFVFCNLPALSGSEFEDFSPVVTVQEAEGATVVVTRETALSRGLRGSPPMRLLSLTVHSDLEAVGLTAALAAALAEAGVSANVVAGYHHDHIFIPDHQAERGMSAITALQIRAQDNT